MHLLCQAIESVRSQTVQGIEIVVVDDGSDVPVADKIQNIGSQIFLACQKNSGLNTARNIGLRIAHGDFIALLDDDDLWLPFKTELQLNVLKRFHEAAFVFSDFAIFDENGVKAPQGLSTWCSFPESWKYGLEFNGSALELGLPLPPDGSDYRVYFGRIYHELLFDPLVLPSTALIRRTVIQEDAPFPADNIHCGDWQFFAKLSRNFPCVYISLATTLNRSHGDAVRLTRKSPIIRIRDRISLIEQVWKSDDAFMCAHCSEVKRVEAEQLKRLSLMCLLENRKTEAIEYLDRCKRLPSASMDIKWWILNLAARFPHIPFAFALRILRRIKRSIQI
jgi:glycosyltransferase involved in cell wall biosynthesis